MQLITFPLHDCPIRSKQRHHLTDARFKVQIVSITLKVTVFTTDLVGGAA